MGSRAFFMKERHNALQDNRLVAILQVIRNVN